MGRTSWSNWAGNQVAHPISRISPTSLDQLVSFVKAACDKGEHVKCVGSGHSFTGAAVTDGHLISIEHFSGVKSIDRTTMEIVVGAGTVLHQLNALLDKEGLALANLGDIVYQTVAGAISTSTHGTGRLLPGLSGQVLGFTLVDGLGNVHECSEHKNSDIFRLGRVSVGALGIITEYRLRVVEAFRLHAREQAMPLSHVLENIDKFVDTNDHFEFFWLPHTPWALTKTNNRTEEALRPLPKVKGWIEKTFVENFAFGALCRLGRMKPSLIPRLATALPSSGKREYIDQSFKIYASPRLVRFYEMEHAIPRSRVKDALEEIQQLIDDKGYLLNFPVEVRFTAADDVPLSTSFERESAYIAVHVYKGMEFEPFFKDVDQLLRKYDSRPHWGKIHYRTKEDLVSQYRLLDNFLALRDRLDPHRMFSNTYTQQVFGQ